MTKDIAYEEVEMLELFRSIPKKYGEVLLLYYVNQMTAKEIADVLSIKQAAVEKRLSRGRKLLRKEIISDG